MDQVGELSAFRRRRTALFMLFALPGLAISSYLARTPDIRAALHASTELMGIVMFGVSIGSMLGIVISPRLISRLGPRALTAVGMTCIVLSMPVVGVGAEVGLAGVAAGGLCLFGFGMGSSEIAINTEAAAVERALGTAVLPAVHGCFSLGTVVGALVGVGCGHASISVGLHLGLVGAIGAPILLTQVRHLSPRNPSTPLAHESVSLSTVWRDRRLLLIGAIVLSVALAEGAATDWLPLVMVDGHGSSAVAGSMVFAAFAAAMTVGRFGGGYFLNRHGRRAVFRFSAGMSAVGIGCVVLVDNQLFAGLAVLLWGLGLSVGFPIAISAAGDTGDRPAARVAFVATMGYTAFLVGPPTLGILGEDYGLRSALLLPLSLVALSFLLAPALGDRHAQRRTERPSDDFSRAVHLD